MMKARFLILVFLLTGVLSYSQTEIYFKYDEAGNQKYRGTNANGNKRSQANTVVPPSVKPEEEKF